MRFVVDILHPIDAHIFHDFIVRMSEKGHAFLITSRQKECATDLLDAGAWSTTSSAAGAGGLPARCLS